MRSRERGALPEGTRLRLVQQARKLAGDWEVISHQLRLTWIDAILHRLVIHTDHVEIRIDIQQLRDRLLGTKKPEGVNPTPPRVASLQCPFRHVPQGRALRLVIGNTSLTTDASRQAIFKAIARARVWSEELTIGKAASIRELAGMHGLSKAFIHLHLRLVPLSPRSLEHLLTRPESLPVSLDELLTMVPLNWSQQRFDSTGKPA